MSKNGKMNMMKFLFSLLFEVILLSACSFLNINEPITPSPTISNLSPPIATKKAHVTVTNPSPSPTAIPTQTSKPSLSDLLPKCANTGFSPDQKWAVGYCNGDETWIVGVDQTSQWIISYGEYYGRKFDSGDGRISPFYWTPDGQYLYLTIDRSVSGPLFFGNGWGIISLDLTDGSITEILNPIQESC